MKSFSACLFEIIPVERKASLTEFVNDKDTLYDSIIMRGRTWKVKKTCDISFSSLFEVKLDESFSVLHV